MTKPKFKIGQTVRLISTGSARRSSDAAYEVVRIRPFSDGEHQYCVRNRSEMHERAVRESELTA